MERVVFRVGRDGVREDIMAIASRNGNFLLPQHSLALSAKKTGITVAARLYGEGHLRARFPVFECHISVGAWVSLTHGHLQ